MHKRIAAQCNNAAWDLIERDILDAAECLRLVSLAATASFHWGEIRTPDNVAHADLLLAWALARTGAGPAAVCAATRVFNYFAARTSGGADMAFPHAAMAVACHCVGDPNGHRRHYLEAERLGRLLPPAGAKHFEAAFRTVARPS